MDTDTLRARYLDERVPVAALAAEASVNPSTIHRRLHAAGIPLRGATGRADWSGVLTSRRLRAAHRRGDTVAEIAEQYGAPPRVVRDHLTQLGLIGIADAELAGRYEAGETLGTLAVAASVSVRTVGRRIASAGGKIRPPGRPPRLTPRRDGAAATRR